ncbi:MAG: TetR/AcrR family transcriptional regulator [Candidatus Omnitrophica bacterium]|nr:TetR/AcrR family transcriptional regulator [Candidatus Omnitrophota bacterium]
MARNKFKILDTTVRLISDRGFSQISVDDILRESNVQKSNFYYHFRTKEDLAIAVLDEMMQKVDEEIWQGILQDKSLSPKQRLDKLIEKLVSDFETAGGKIGDPFGNLISEVNSHDERFQVKVNDYFIRYSSFLEGVIHEGIEEDEFHQSLIPREAAEAILSQIQGAYLLSKAYQDPGALRRNIEFLINVISV